MRINDIQRIEDNHKFIVIDHPWSLNKEYFWNLNPDDVPFPKLKRLILPVYDIFLTMGSSRNGDRKKYQGKPTHVCDVLEFNDLYNTTFTPWNPHDVFKGIGNEYPVPWNKKWKKYLIQEQQNMIDDYLEKHPDKNPEKDYVPWVTRKEPTNWFIKEFDKPPSCEELLNEIDLLVGKSGDYHHIYLENIFYSDSKGESLGVNLGS